MTTLPATRQRRAHTTGFRQRLQLALLTRSGKKQSLLEKGFTLVELMIVIVIVGILAAVALPNFLGARDKAAAGALIGTMTGFAKECATKAVNDDTTAMAAVQGVTFSDTDCSNGATLSNTDLFDAGSVTGMKCGVQSNGSPAVAVAASRKCNLAVDDDGAIVGSWTAS